MKNSIRLLFCNLCMSLVLFGGWFIASSATAPVATAGYDGVLEPDPRLLESVCRIYIDGDPSASGTAIGPSLILTARHVVENREGKLERNLQVELRMKSETAKGTALVDADVVAIDRNHDIALLSIDVNAPRTMELAKNVSMRNGSAVWVMGFPMGTPGVSCTLGYLTNMGGAQPDEPTNWQCTANAFFGNSGGAVVDAHSGELVGVLVAGMGSDWQMAPNISLFVPVEHVHAMLKNVKQDK